MQQAVFYWAEHRTVSSTLVLVLSTSHLLVLGFFFIITLMKEILEVMYL